jgi:predicted transcriptional regulator of viral defense system
MDAKLADIPPIPVPFDVLKQLYATHRSPHDKISRLVKEGSLIRLKKGLFLPLAKPQKTPLPFELIANVLRGPSYVSLQTALAFYGLIPERVYEIRSMTTKRSKKYTTALGRFDYVSVREDYFSIGIRSTGSDEARFLIAAPEKALCDMIVTTSGLRLQSSRAMREYLEEDLRVDLPDTLQMQTAIFDAVIETGIKKREAKLLKEYCINGR